MDAIAMHAVCIEYGVEAAFQFFARDADIHVDGLRSAPQTVEVPIQEGEAAMMQANAFPYAVAQHEAAVEDADLCVRSREVVPVDVDDDRCVAIISYVIVGALCH